MTKSIIVSLCVIGLLWVFSDTEITDKVDYELYCKMTAKWEEFKHLPPEDRPGWPPYKGRCDGTK